MYENVPAVREAVEEDQALFGTLDSWIMYKLTGGKDGGIHVTDGEGCNGTRISLDAVLGFMRLVWLNRVALLLVSSPSM